jgi:hypothetical protein
MEKTPEQIDYQTTLDTFKTNTIGPMLAVKHFSKFMPKRGSVLENINGLNKDVAVWAMLSAKSGSIEENKLGILT